MRQTWRWAGACSIGTSHLKTGTECQDRAGCYIVHTSEADFVSAIVSDGAGSASHGALGAAIVASHFQRMIRAHLWAEGSLGSVDAEKAASWLDEIRERIFVRSARAELRPRDFAATLIAAIVGPSEAMIVHVGDGAAVLRRKDSGEWLVPSWPFHGEYASTTRFVVDDPEPVIDLVRVEGEFDRVVVFSDGIENLVLDMRARTAPAPFFERLTEPVAQSIASKRDREFSARLRAYLSSERVSEATDDDKSVIIAVRV